MKFSYRLSLHLIIKNNLQNYKLAHIIEEKIKRMNLVITDNLQFAAVYPNLRIDDKDIRRTIEDSLNEFSFSFISFPTNIFTSPMMHGQTEHGHSSLQIVNKNVRLFITFDEKFCTDREKCFSYAYSKIDSITKALNQIDTSLHSGIVIQYLLKNVTDNDDKVIDLINHGSISITDGSHFFNFSKEFSIVYNNSHYLNFRLSSMRLKDDSTQQIVGINVDINNRYTAEIIKRPIGDDAILKIQNLHHQISEDILLKLLKEGELDLNGLE